MTQTKNAPFSNIPILNKLGWKHIIILIVALLLAVGAFIVVRDVVKYLPGTVGGFNPVENTSDSTPDPSAGVPTPDIVIPVSDLPAAWDGASRVNILVMGLDYADWAEDRDGPSRTDSMVLFTIDPQTKTAGMLSIPRDLWVNIPGGYGYAKINTAHAIGEGNKLPGGGPALAAKTVSEFIGVPVHHTAVISFEAFTRAVDELGCINIWAFQAMDIDPIGPGNTIHLDADKGYCFNGDELLAYARNRHTEGGDVDRARRTQQVILALRDAVLDPNRFPTLVARAPAMYQELASGVKTTLSLDDMLKLAMLMTEIPSEQIDSRVIDYKMANLTVDPQGLSILLPIPDRIRELRDSMFASGNSAGPQASGDLIAKMKEEGATVAVLNGTYTEGLAARTADYLKSQGVNVVQTGNPEQIGYSLSKIVDYRGRPYVAQYLYELFNMTTDGQYVISYDPAAAVDVAIVVGDDWVYNNPMP